MILCCVIFLSMSGISRLYKAALLQAIKGNNQIWFTGTENSPIKYIHIQSILNWLPINGLQAYKKRFQIKQILNHTLTNKELYTISTSQDITETAKELNRSYQTIRAAKNRLMEIL